MLLPTIAAAGTPDTAALPTKLSKKERRKAVRSKKFRLEALESGTIGDMVFREVRDEVVQRVKGMSANAIPLAIEERDEWAVILSFALLGETIVEPAPQPIRSA